MSRRASAPSVGGRLGVGRGPRPPKQPGRPRRPPGERVYGAAPGPRPNPKRCKPCVGSPSALASRSVRRWSSTRTGPGSRTATSPPRRSPPSSSGSTAAWSSPDARPRQPRPRPAQRLGPQYADILAAHAQMIADPTLRRDARSRIERDRIPPSTPSARCSTPTPPGSNGSPTPTWPPAPPTSATSSSESSAT